MRRNTALVIGTLLLVLLMGVGGWGEQQLLPPPQEALALFQHLPVFSYAGCAMPGQGANVCLRLAVVFDPPPHHPPGDAAPVLGNCPGGGQDATCASLQDELRKAWAWIVILIGAAGLLWVLATCFQVTGLAGQARTHGAWRLVLERLVITCLVVFITWRLHDVAVLIEEALAAHVNDQSTLSPSGAIIDQTLPVPSFMTLWTILISIVGQAALLWIILRLTLEAVAGLAALEGYGRRGFGTVVRSLVELGGLGLLMFFTPTLVGTFFSFITSL